ncbi:creatininase family protein [Prolixibacteraceae bacterium Z1-6]|uniref:Creatininase family protein n=1 Tax=Draconibacterium aestuarii TaxID=2998507 RepID=A0A9X3J6E6_9BACT|nr:creatininase family protein [Prolixibacteraceae bacterium Z1-6]
MKNKIDYPDYMWATLTWPEIAERLKIVDTAILPCGSIEQHGPHLPLDVDYFDSEYMAKKVAEACADPKPFVLPPVPYGVAYHHSEFKGTICVSNNALSALIYDIGMSLAHNGIKKLVILNGHGDNAPTLNYAAQMINRDAKIFVCVETGETSDVDLYNLIETQNDIHAGEIETSTTLAIRPELVDMDKAVDDTLDLGNEYLDFNSERGVSWYVHTKTLTKSGVMGNATLATAEKGQKMWKIMIRKMAEFVETIKNTPSDKLFQNRY